MWRNDCVYPLFVLDSHACCSDACGNGDGKHVLMLGALESPSEVCYCWWGVQWVSPSEVDLSQLEEFQLEVTLSFCLESPI